MKVAVAIITNGSKILITQRPLHVPHGGYWEFPGGKLESGELPEEALVREIREEIGIEVLQYNHLGEIQYDYHDKSVQLIVFHVTQFSGIPSCREGQLNMKWITHQHLRAEHFPEANRGIFDLIPVIEASH